MTHIEYNNACKFDTSISNATDAMTKSGDKPTVQCPPLKSFTPPLEVYHPMHAVKLRLSELNAMWAKLHLFENSFFIPQTKWKVKVKEILSQQDLPM